MDRSHEPGKNKKIVLNLFILVFSVYAVTSSVSQIRFIPQSALRYEVTSGIVEKCDLSIPNGFGVKGKDGRYYSYYGLGWPVLTVPFYVLGKYTGSGSESLINAMQIMAAAITVVIVYLFCVTLRYSNRSSLVAAIFYGFGSMAWPLAKQPFDHVVETLFVFLSVYFLYLFVLGKRISRLVLSAVFLGIALNIRLTSILVIPGLFLMGRTVVPRGVPLKQYRNDLIKYVATYGTVLIPFLFAILWYNYYRFGSIYETGFQLIAKETGLDFFSGTPLFTGLRGFLWSPGKGIFFYSPVAFLFFWGIVPFYRKYPELSQGFIITMLSFILFFSKNIYWHGDWAWGPRYLLVLLPFLIVPVAELVEKETDSKKNKPSIRKTVIYGIFGLGILIQSAAVSVHCYKYFIDLQLEKNLQFVVTKEPGVPTIIEPPPEVHFDWKMSPVLAQFRSLYEMGKEVGTYRYVDLPEDASLDESIKVYPLLHIYDFWWLYAYFIYGSRAGFLFAAILIGAGVVSAFRLKTASRRPS